MNQQNPFKWRHFEAEIILLCVRWYLRVRHVTHLSIPSETERTVLLQKRWEERNGHEAPLLAQLRPPLQTGWR